MDGRADLARVLRHVRHLADPDVICLQEVADNMPDLAGLGREDQFSAIAAACEDHRPVVATPVEIFDEDGERRRFGNMILSRLPVRQVLRHTLPWPGVAGRTMPRMLLETSVVTRFGPVRIMTTHLEYFAGELRALAVEAIRRVHAEGASRARAPRAEGMGPYAVAPGAASAILTGDLNMRPEDPTRLRLLEPYEDGTPAFLDAWTVRNGDVPHPHSFCIADQRYGPPHCADYVLLTPDLAARVDEVAYDVETRLSDHQPVLLTLRDA